MTEQESELLSAIREKRGYVLPLHRFLDGNDPEFLETYDRFFTLATDEHNGLSTHVRELVLLAIDLSLGVNSDVAATHAKRAIAAGADVKETIGVVELVALGKAAQGLNAGIAALLKALEQ